MDGNLLNAFSMLPSIPPNGGMDGNTVVTKYTKYSGSWKLHTHSYRIFYIYINMT